ncbi:hypothetical protein HanPI659440_Chr10g0366551 [Helianthus annuus]|uniref:Uncharacterized protein n=1 Tax=Helianthus annuus TaxID=4232 RepID=A0A251TP27_HELAN|nr:hypothetical protein HanXRQr2_Chr04g0146881 [Helianthus annuus]KAJ0587006.1 hypothetical protein HanIR_Chr04g0158221 [Helianthus annuus]KAJ0742648.1 hypothetical protein HanPI659440_Chr10g0366551 [Helianthus annuus]KAJ0929784.1 hypothetical protein HanPSC8_Chr04g0141611 [Helianthus annuus]
MDSSFTLFLTLTIIITPPPPPFSPPLTAFSDHVSGDLSAARLVPLNRLLFPITFQKLGSDHLFMSFRVKKGKKKQQPAGRTSRIFDIC